MRKALLAAAAVAALIAVPGIASADPDSAGNAAAGAAVGGPVGAAVGAGVGGTVGAGSTPRTREEVIVHERGPSVRERNCVRDSFGNVSCTEIRR